MSDVVLPQLGETVTEGTITRWLKQPGEYVELDEPLYEVSTDKVDTEVPAPVAGMLAEILVAEGETVEVGTLLAKLSSDDGAAAPAAEPESASEPEPPAPAPTEPVSDPKPEPAPESPAQAAPESATAPASESAPAAPAPVSEPEPAAPVPPKPAKAKDRPVPASPVVRRLLRKHGLNVSDISGTGPRGRITRKDAEAAIAALGTAATGASLAGSPTGTPARAGASPGTRPTASTIVPLSRIRQVTAEHMVRSKATSPHVLTAVEVDFENVEKARRAHRQEWRQEEGFSLTYLPFIARAVCDALDEYPHINASIEGDNLLVHRNINLAVAVDLEFQGLLAPVIHGAEDLRLRAIARKVVDLSRRAKAKQLTPDELAGGTFTLTNPGQWGTLMQFPIINQPQVAILSTDGITRKPVVVTDPSGSESIAIHSVGVLALAWDHRAFDGAYVAAFLDELREIIQTRNWDEELA